MIKEGDLILLSDEQTLFDLKDLSKGGLEVTVAKITVHDEGDIHYTICDLVDSQLVVVFKKLNGNLEQRCVYWQCDDFVPGSREELVNNGSHWIFKEPPPNFKYDDLEFADEITSPEGSYERFLTSFDVPEDSAIAEWEAKFDTDNPYLIVIEQGDYVRCLQGSEIRESELTIFNRS